MLRINYLDRARAIGMFLVYYGHFVGTLAGISANRLAVTQWRLIYSFHVPLFFFLAGIFWKSNLFFLQVLSDKFKTRILPVITFSLFSVPFWLALAPSEFLRMLSLSHLYLQGMPLLNLATWFLICLFSVEILATLTSIYLKITPLRLVIYSAIYFIIGFYAFVRGLATVDGFPGLLPRLLHIEDAFIVIVFFFAGYLLRNPLTLLAKNHAGWIISLPVLIVTGYGVLQTFELNQDTRGGVLVIASIYGNPVLFFLTAFAGIFFVIALSRMLVLIIPDFNFVSQNSLIYLGLNGLCFHFLDGYVARTLPINLQSHLSIALYTSAYVTLMMLIFAPVVLVFRRWFPQLVGLPWSQTSLLPPIGTRLIRFQRNIS